VSVFYFPSRFFFFSSLSLSLKEKKTRAKKTKNFKLLLTCLRHQLDRHLGSGGHLVQVVDQLGQVLDRVDVVVRRRRDQGHSRLRPPQARNVRGHLLAGQLPALSRLRALRDLDLELLGVDEELRRDAEAARGDLLDAGCGRVARLEAAEVRQRGGPPLGVDVGHRLPPDGVLAALARVGLASDPVHRHRDRLVRLPRDRAQRHPARAEARHDGGGGLDLVDRDRLSAGRGHELEAVAEDRGRGVGKVLHVRVVRGLRRGALASEA